MIHQKVLICSKAIIIPTKLSLRSASNISSKKLLFDNRTAIVTGAGRGLGQKYALLLASRGAKVVVNDFGGSKSGQFLDSQDNKRPADLVVDEIKRLYPNADAIANYESIGCEQGVKRLVEASYNAFGNKRIDILINNAGILRDKSFSNMTIDDWDQVHNIHLRGSFLASHACWPIMRQQKYGKIIMTSSTSGIYGNFGQANYAAAKMGLIGLSNTLAIEGRSRNISCNAVVPLAASRLTEGIIPEDLAKRLKPSYVAPLVVWLCHQECKTSGAVIEAAGRWFGRHRIQRSSGKYLSDLSETSDACLEQLEENWQDICDNFQGSTQIDSFEHHIGELMEALEGSPEK